MPQNRQTYTCDGDRLPAHALESLTYNHLNMKFFTYQLKTEWNIITVELWKGYGTEQLSLACTDDLFTKYQKFCGPLPQIYLNSWAPTAILLVTITNKK